MAPEPQLLYVNSKITEPSQLSPEQFTSWYNDIHIPDIFETSGIKKAYRYVTIENKSSSSPIDRPYLALYAVKSKEYFTSKEFYSIPVTHDSLPGPNREIFDVANFDTRYYTFLSEVGTECFQVPYVLTLQAQNIENLQQELGNDLSMRTYRVHFFRQNRLDPAEHSLGTPPDHLALLWFKTEEDLARVASKAEKFGKLGKFKLLKAFSAEE